jgi:hypothetical protein
LEFLKEFLLINLFDVLGMKQIEQYLGLMNYFIPLEAVLPSTSIGMSSASSSSMERKLALPTPTITYSL